VDTWGSGQKNEIERACHACGTRYAASEALCPFCFAPSGERYSRWHGGPTTFGPVTKIILTSILAGVAIGYSVLVVGTIGPIGFPRTLEVSVPCAVLIGLLWRRARVR
jgi:hypothetical protein